MTLDLHRSSMRVQKGGVSVWIRCDSFDVGVNEVPRAMVRTPHAGSQECRIGGIEVHARSGPRRLTKQKHARDDEVATPT